MQNNNIISWLGEEDFKSSMRRKAEPFLKACESEGYIKSYDGADIFYRTYRIRDARAAIIISHWFCEFAEKYKEVVYYFLQYGYSVYIPEHRGHGYSSKETGDPEKVHIKNYEEYVRDFHFFMKKIVDPAERKKILFCHSMGGAIGVRYLEEYPGSFDAAVLSSPMLGIKTGKYPFWAAKITAYFFCAIGKGEHYAAGQHGFCRHPGFETSGCISKQRYLYIYEMRLKDKRYRTYGGSYAWVAAGMKAVKKLQKKKNAEKIQIPLLIMTAESDDMVDNHKIRLFAKKVKSAKLLEMKKTKHEIYNAGTDVRRVYYETMLSFLEETMIL